MRKAMIGAAVVLMVLAGAADAQNAPAKRNFVLLNHSRQEIEHVTVTTTDGKVQRLDYIPANQSRHIQTAGRACIAAIRVWLHDRRQLRADKLNNCTNPLITVTVHGIALGTPTR